jgi:hypothetical protein
MKPPPPAVLGQGRQARAVFEKNGAQGAPYTRIALNPSCPFDSRPTAHRSLLTPHCLLLTTDSYLRHSHMIRVRIMLMRMQVPNGK